MNEQGTMILPDEKIVSKIFSIRGKKVMLDRDLAELYDVETRALNQAVRRNPKRFPPDFMFVLTKAEMENWISQIVISNREKMGLRRPPLAFTEQGVAMLSSVLNSDRAIMVNIKIIRVFTKMREILDAHKEIFHKLEEIEKKDIEQDQQIRLIFKYLRHLKETREKEVEFQKRRRIGFKNGE